jgi:hypothetical protein
MVDPNRFYSYDSAFDPIQVIRRHAVTGLQVTPGYLTNYLGVLIDPAFLPHILTGREGTVEGLPIPANWHADIAEWGAALRAVELASGHFTAIECGCGWACWLNNTGVAARRRGLPVTLIGIEADQQYVSFAQQSLTINGFVLPDFTIYNGVAAASGGTAYFPRLPTGGTDWGRSPVFSQSDPATDPQFAFRSHVALPCVPLTALPVTHRIDLLHIDIQGGELALVRDSLAFIIAHVAYLVIGTHSRHIEGELHELLVAAGLTLEIDRPAINNLGPTPQLTVDGVQGWRNGQI